MTRPSWDELWLEIARVVSFRSTCPRASVGVVLVSEFNQVISVGYNGAPHGLPHCTDVGCIHADDGSCVRAVHAESNAILQAGSVFSGPVTLYSTLSPCWRCAQLISQTTIDRVVTTKQYRKVRGLPDPLEMLRNNGVVVHVITPEFSWEQTTDDLGELSMGVLEHDPTMFNEPCVLVPKGHHRAEDNESR